jgi:hypothetical protein
MFASQQQAVVVWAVVVALFVIFSWSWLNSQREELHHRVDLLETHRTKLEGRLDDVLEKILMLEHIVEHLESGHDHTDNNMKNKNTHPAPPGSTAP